MERNILSLTLGAGVGLLTTGILGLLWDSITVPIMVTGIGAFLLSFAIAYYRS